MDPNVQAILEMLNGFYDAAWNRLVLVGALMVGLVGIVIPVLITVYQRWTWQQDREGLVRDMLEDTDNYLKPRTLEIEERLNSELSMVTGLLKSHSDRLDTRLTGTISLAEASTEYADALRWIIDEEPYFALGSVLNALKGMVRAGYDARAQTIFRWVDGTLIDPVTAQPPSLLAKLIPDLEELSEVLQDHCPNDVLTAGTKATVRNWIGRLQSPTQHSVVEATDK